MRDSDASRLEESLLHSRLSSYKRRQASAMQMVFDAGADLVSQGGYVSFSGGKDSVVVLHMAISTYPDIPVCFFKSDLEFPENVTYIGEMAKQLDCNLHIIPTRSVLDVFVSEGWFNHSRDDRDTGEDLHAVKMLEPAAKAREQFGDVVFWGMRSDESRGRGALLRPTRGITRYNDGRIAYAPLWNWTSQDVEAYCARHQILLNPLYAKMADVGVPEKERRVGSIFDGANIDNGRIGWLKRGWPEEYDKLRLSLPRIEEFS